MAKTPRKGGDLNVTAFATLNQFLSKNDPAPTSTAPTPDIAAALSNPELRRELMREMGRRGGKKGGKARAKSLSKKQRSEIARAAALKRWNGGNSQTH